MDTVIIRFRVGSGDEGTTIYDKVHPRVMALVNSDEYPGLILHTCSKTDDGIVIVDVWEDASAWQAMFSNPEVVKGFEEIGIPQPEVEIRPLHNRERGRAFASF